MSIYSPSIFARGVGALAIAAAGLIAAPAIAQTAGDVGVDPNGNTFTYVVNTRGEGRWVRGRAGTGGIERTILAERYVPGIWVDPDGCEHWVMDDGFEGFMTPHVTRDGKPVCR